MRCFCELTNQSTALTQREGVQKCGKVLQREKRKAQQVIVYRWPPTNGVPFPNSECLDMALMSHFAEF